MPTGGIKLLTGNSHPELAQAVASRLNIPLTRCTVKKFSDGEINVSIGESVRDEDVYILQTGFNPSPYPSSHLSQTHYVSSIPATPSVNSASLTQSVDQRTSFGNLREESKGTSRPHTPAVHHSHIPPNGDAPSRPASPGAFHPHLHPSSDPNDLLMELLIMISACKTASARRITAIIPCYPYSRMDRKDRSRAPITAKLVANTLQTAGCDHVITMELHASQIQGFFDIPVDNLWTEPIIANFVRGRIENWKDVIIVSPDAGGAKRATALADRLNVDFALINRRRAKKEAANPQSHYEDRGKMEILVGDVKDKIAVLIDDMCDTGETLSLACQALIDSGARKVFGIVAHGLLSGSACEIINQLPIEKLVVTNSISQREHIKAVGSKMEVMDIVPVLAESIRRTHNGESISLLFTDSGVGSF